MNADIAAVQIEIEGKSRLVFDKWLMQAELRKIGRVVQEDSKKLLSRRAISNPGDYPGLKTGDTRRSIKTRISKSGWTAIVEPKRTPDMDKTHYYPQILVKGRKASGGKKGKKGASRLEPRADPVQAALEARRGQIQNELFAALQAAVGAKG